MLAVGTVQVPVSVPTYKLPKQPAASKFSNSLSTFQTIFLLDKAIRFSR